MTDTLHPKEFVGRHKAHGRKYERATLLEYQKFMNAMKAPVVMQKCGLVVSKKYQSLQLPLMGKLLILVVVSHLVNRS